MDDVASIGEVLRSKREGRSLGLQEVHEATKITSQNLAALEENRFDAFPNKVYARAFLRDYANFLDLDSASLLARYEEELGGAREVEPIRPAGKGAWRIIGYALAVLVVLGGAGAGSYFWWTGCEQQRRVPGNVPRAETPSTRDEGILPAQPAPARTREPQPLPEKPQPAPPTPPVPSEKIALDVSALRDVWVDAKSDGKTVCWETMPKGTSKRFTAKRAIYIHTGMAGAVQLKFNGVLQPPLGTLKTQGRRTFRREKPAGGSPAAPAPPSSF